MKKSPGLLLMLLAGVTSAQTTIVVQDPYAGFAEIVKHNKEQMEAAGTQAGQIINGVTRTPRAVAMILTIKCGKYVEGTVMYDNNTTKVVSFDPTPASDANLATVRTAFPNLRVAAIDVGC